MNGEKISNFDGALLTALVVMTNTLSVLPGAEGKNVWVSCLLAGAAAIICMLPITYLCDKLPDASFYEVIRSCVGRRMGAIIGVTLTVISLLSFTVSLTVFSRFVQITALPQTPQIILPLAIALIAAFSVSRDIQPALSSARILFWFVAGVVVLFLLFGTSRIYKPLLFSRGGTAEELFASSGEIFLNRFGALPAFSVIYAKMADKKTRKKYLISALGGASLAIALISAICVAMLGASAATADFYPVYTAMSLFSFGGFVQHTEILACITMTLCLFFKGCLCISFSTEMLDGASGVSREREISLPLALIAAYSTQLIYRDLPSLRGLLKWKWQASLFLSLYIAVPVLLLAANKIKKKKTE